jgi:Domain of unknown function (DUF4347)
MQEKGRIRFPGPNGQKPCCRGNIRGDCSQSRGRRFRVPARWEGIRSGLARTRHLPISVASRGMRLILEPRFLFDASVAATVRAAHDSVHHSGPDAGSTEKQSTDTAATSPAMAREVASHPAADPALPASKANEDTFGSDQTPSRSIQAATSTESVLFVDPWVANWQTLAAGVTAGTKVIVLDPAAAGLAQVSTALSGVRTVNFHARDFATRAASS